MVFGNFSVPLVIGGVAGLSQLKTTRDKQEDVLKADAFVKRETEYFKNNIGKISSAEEFVQDTRILRYGLAAYGLEEELFKTAYIQRILESDLSDPTSAANRISDPRWQEFAKAFVKSAPDIPGPLQGGFASKQTAKGYAIELSRYKTDSEIDTITAQADKFRDQMKNITQASDLLKPENKDAFNFIKKTFGVETAAVSDSEAIEFLESDTYPPLAPAGYQDAREALTFYDETVSGVSTTDRKPNTDKVIEDIVKRRFEKELKQASGVTAYEKRGSDFRTALNTHTTADELISDATSMKFLREAFNLTKDTTDDATIKSYLESADGTGVPTVWNEVREFLGYHTVTEENPTYTPPSYAKISGVLADHKEREIRVGSNIDKFYRFEKEAKHFALKVSLTASNQDFVADARVLRFAMNSFGLATDALDSQKALKVLDNQYDFNPNLESDKKWREFQKAFSFTVSDNSLRTFEDDIASTIEEAFVDSTYLVAVGNSDPTLRQALYFDKRIQQIADSASTSRAGWLRIIGETPMADAFQKVFILPSSFGQLDLDKQVEVYQTRFSNQFGQSDLKAFNDQTFRESFITQFITFSELSNNSSGSSTGNIALSLLS